MNSDIKKIPPAEHCTATAGSKKYNYIITSNQHTLYAPPTSMKVTINRTITSTVYVQNGPFLAWLTSSGLMICQSCIICHVPGKSNS